MIVKVQRPINRHGFPEDPAEPDIMVYASGHEHQVLVTFESLPAWLRGALRDQPKVFAVADWRAGRWVFLKLAGWHPW